jgi:phage-related baseplate assembly protein
MSVPTLDQLYTAKTKDDVLAVVLEVAQAVGLPITAWQSGSVGRELLEICAQIASNYSATSTVAASGGLLDYATAAWLTLNAFEIYEVEREAATFGTCTERLTSTANVSYSLNPGDMRFYNTRTGKTYTSTTGGTLAPGNVTPQTLDLTITADEAGSASNAALGDITGIVTPLFGVTATNLEVLVGNDEETDDALRTRSRESMAKASPNGPGDAYNYFAKTATRSTDGTVIGVTRTNVVEGNGTIFIYVADASGPIDDQDLSDVDSSIQLNCVPTGFTAVTFNANPVNVPISATVYLQRGATLTIEQLTTIVTDRLVAYFGAAPIGGYQAGGGFIFTSAIIGQIFESSSQIIRVVLTAPTVDVALNSDQVAVLGTITLTAGAS